MDRVISSVEDDCGGEDVENPHCKPVSENHTHSVSDCSSLPPGASNNSSPAAEGPVSELLTKVAAAVKKCEALRNFSCVTISSLPLPPPLEAYTKVVEGTATGQEICGNSFIEPMEVEDQNPVETAAASTVELKGSHGGQLHPLPRKFQAALLVRRLSASFAFEMEIL